VDLNRLGLELRRIEFVNDFAVQVHLLMMQLPVSGVPCVAPVLEFLRNAIRQAARVAASKVTVIATGICDDLPLVAAEEWIDDTRVDRFGDESSNDPRTSHSVPRGPDRYAPAT
jgi:hypothetical protein